MGNCLTSGRDGERRPRSSNRHTVVTAGKNQPLNSAAPVWQSEVPITRGQLLSKRDEFWDTAPAFEGRKEIWDALKAAAYALENRDAKLAQAVIDGASISLPAGSLTDCYDELGNRYQLPLYVLNAPMNLVEADDENGDGTGTDVEGEDAAAQGEETSLKLRLSTGKDLKITVRMTETVAKAKQKLSAVEFDSSLESSQQRWFFGGRILSDKLRIEDAKIPKGFVVQVIVAELPAPALPTSGPEGCTIHVVPSPDAPFSAERPSEPFLVTDVSPTPVDS